MKISRVSDSLPAYTRAKNGDCFDKIQQLRGFYGEAMTATLLGIKKVSLNWREQPIPVVRLAFILWRMTFRPGVPVSLFEMLTAGKYERGMPQGSVNPVEDWTI